jgi:hypothetical protein
MITDFSTTGSAGLKHCNNGTVEKPKSASVPLLIRLKTFTQGQIIKNKFVYYMTINILDSDWTKHYFTLHFKM